MLPAQGGVRVFAPLLAYFKRKNRTRIYYYVVGGWLPEFLSDKPRLAKTLASFDGIWVETNTMKSALEGVCFGNVSVIPNFKELAPLAEDELIYADGEPYKLCTFSRVMKEKGIEDAANAVLAVNKRLGRTAFTLDIYGQVEPGREEWFEDFKSKLTNEVRYCGCVDSSESVRVLAPYFALLFPTFYEGEGFAGTIIDAYCAGLPVIASDWRYNPELVPEAVGFIHAAKSPEALAQILADIYAAPNTVASKKSACLREAEKYSAKAVAASIINELS